MAGQIQRHKLNIKYKNIHIYVFIWIKYQNIKAPLFFFSQKGLLYCSEEQVHLCKSSPTAEKVEVSLGFVIFTVKPQVEAHKGDTRNQSLT